MEINLISDTVTKPCESMIAAMINAKVGDDVFKEDPTVNKLEKKNCQTCLEWNQLYFSLWNHGKSDCN